jgi:hypothetical protein
MSRYFSPVIISSASFLLGIQFSDTIRDKFYQLGFIRQGHAESVAVETRPLPDLIKSINHKTVAHTEPEPWKQASRASEIMKFGFPG